MAVTVVLKSGETENRMETLKPQLVLKRPLVLNVLHVHVVRAAIYRCSISSGATLQIYLVAIENFKLL